MRIVEIIESVSVDPIENLCHERIQNFDIKTKNFLCSQVPKVSPSKFHPEIRYLYLPKSLSAKLPLLQTFIPKIGMSGSNVRSDLLKVDPLTLLKRRKTFGVRKQLPFS